MCVAGHEVWDSASVNLSTSVLLTGAVSAGGLMALLASTAAAPQLGRAQSDPAQVEISISLFLTVLLMAAWMFVNWCVPPPCVQCGVHANMPGLS